MLGGESAFHWLCVLWEHFRLKPMLVSFKSNSLITQMTVDDRTGRSWKILSLLYRPSLFGWEPETVSLSPSVWKTAAAVFISNEDGCSKVSWNESRFSAFQITCSWINRLNSALESRTSNHVCPDDQYLRAEDQTVTFLRPSDPVLTSQNHTTQFNPQC